MISALPLSILEDIAIHCDDSLAPLFCTNGTLKRLVENSHIWSTLDLTCGLERYIPLRIYRARANFTSFQRTIKLYISRPILYLVENSVVLRRLFECSSLVEMCVGNRPDECLVTDHVLAHFEFPLLQKAVVTVRGPRSLIFFHKAPLLQTLVLCGGEPILIPTIPMNALRHLHMYSSISTTSLMSNVAHVLSSSPNLHRLLIESESGVMCQDVALLPEYHVGNQLFSLDIYTRYDTGRLAAFITSNTLLERLRQVHIEQPRHDWLRPSCSFSIDNSVLCSLMGRLFRWERGKCKVDSVKITHTKNVQGLLLGLGDHFLKLGCTQSFADQEPFGLLNRFPLILSNQGRYDVNSVDCTNRLLVGLIVPADATLYYGCPQPCFALGCRLGSNSSSEFVFPSRLVLDFTVDPIVSDMQKCYPLYFGSLASLVIKTPSNLLVDYLEERFRHYNVTFTS